MTETDRYQINKGDEERLYVHDAEKQLLKSLVRLIRGSPPKSEWTDEDLGGLCMGPTGLAYLFLKVSKQHPEMVIESKTAGAWTEAYLSGTRHPQSTSIDESKSAPPVHESHCGIINEELCFAAVSAAYTGDLKYVHRFLSHTSSLLTKGGHCELVYGRAGTLYLLRVIRTYVPESASLVNPIITQLIECILANGPPWEFYHGEYYGVGHGAMGILTEIILSDPSYSPGFEAQIAELIALQRPDGHWPKTREDPTALVQLCHGAPGFVLSLLTLRKYYPNLHAQIDDAVDKGRAVTWEQGLLKKVPNICHGVTGNGFVFPPGWKRDHFLGFGTEEMLEEGERKGWWSMGGSYGSPHSLLFGGAGRSWAWLAKDKEDRTYITFNDV